MHKKTQHKKIQYGSKHLPIAQLSPAKERYFLLHAHKKAKQLLHQDHVSISETIQGRPFHVTTNFAQLHPFTNPDCLTILSRYGYRTCNIKTVGQ